VAIRRIYQIWVRLDMDGLGLIRKIIGLIDMLGLVESSSTLLTIVNKFIDAWKEQREMYD
jgi:hypothetical protein